MAWQKTRLYNIWDNMKQRCTNPRRDCYKNYGGRGVTVCIPWLTFANFQEWSLKNGYQDDLTLERLDNDKGYYPENCTWIPKSQQTANRRINAWVTIDNTTKLLAEWCRIYNVPHCTAMRHFKKGTDIAHYFKNAATRLSYNTVQNRGKHAV